MCEIKEETKTKIDRLTASIDRLCGLLEAKIESRDDVLLVSTVHIGLEGALADGIGGRRADISQRQLAQR